jgi:hypothetical protein
MPNNHLLLLGSFQLAMKRRRLGANIYEREDQSCKELFQSDYPSYIPLILNLK